MTEPAVPDPLRLRPHGLEFDQLKELREYLEGMLAIAGPSLKHFQEPKFKGFLHLDSARQRDPDDPFSMASTATCVAFLRAAGKLEMLVPESARLRLRQKMIDGPWKSAGLEENNPFTVSFVLEAIHALGGSEDLDTARAQVVDDKLAGLEKRLIDDDGGLFIDQYDPTAFLTYKALRVLKLWGKPKAKALKAVHGWVWSHLAHESMPHSIQEP